MEIEIFYTKGSDIVQLKDNETGRTEELLLADFLGIAEFHESLMKEAFESAIYQGQLRRDRYDAETERLSEPDVFEQLVKVVKDTNKILYGI